MLSNVQWTIFQCLESVSPVCWTFWRWLNTCAADNGILPQLPITFFSMSLQSDSASISLKTWMNLYFWNMLIFKVYFIFRCCLHVKAVLLATSEHLRWAAGNAAQQMGQHKLQTDAFPNCSCDTSPLQLPHPDFQGCWSSWLHFGKLPGSTDKLI